MPSAYRTQRRVDFCDTDMAGIVHFSNFFRFMESAEQEFLLSLGLGVSMIFEGAAIGFPRVSASCDYLRPAHFPDVLDIDVFIHHIGNKSVTYAFEFSKDGKLLAKGKISSVCCRHTDGHGLESMEIPDTIRHKLKEKRNSV
ncbi:MAG: acyl-CoA thioesterase [Gemmataceae bacterium]